MFTINQLERIKRNKSSGSPPRSNICTRAGYAERECAGPTGSGEGNQLTNSVKQVAEYNEPNGYLSHWYMP
jgi:hypothetical protein